MDFQVISNKGSGSVNEDVLLVADPLFGVFDGATSLRPYKDKQGRTGGYLAASLARNFFFRGSQGKEELYSLALKANKAIVDSMLISELNVNDKLNLWGTTATVDLVKETTFDWLQIGDSAGLVIYDDHSFKPFVEYHEHDKGWQSLWKKLAEEGMLREDVVERIKQEVEQLRKTTNVSGGYGALNGEEGMTDFLQFGTRSLKGVKHILLFTDGLMIPKEDPSQREKFREMVDLFLEGGLEHVMGYVRNVERNDKPGGVAPRRFYKHFYKQHDDIGAIALSF